MNRLPCCGALGSDTVGTPTVFNRSKMRPARVAHVTMSSVASMVMGYHSLSARSCSSATSPSHLVVIIDLIMLRSPSGSLVSTSVIIAFVISSAFSSTVHSDSGGDWFGSKGTGVEGWNEVGVAVRPG